MALDPRKYIISDCTNSRIGAANAASPRKEFFSAIGKIGDIEAGGSAARITSGLRSIEGVSNSIRDGDGTPDGLLGIGSVLGTSLDNGAGWVFDNIGIARLGVEQVNRFNPRVANVAVTQAQQIYQRTTEGDFRLEDFPSAVSDLGNLDVLLNKIFTPGPGDSPEDYKCFATPYAEALAYKYSPKNKFMFMVEFVFSPSYVEQMGSNDVDRFTSFLVKTSTRPNMRFDYEEVNMYNFKTRVAKRSEYDPMTMVFHDDTQNNVARFYHRYLELMSPITRFKGDKSLFEEGGMNFQENQVLTNSASLGALDDNTKTIFSEIKLYHIYDFGRYLNRYTFTSPKLSEIQFDDLDMSSSETPQAQMSFFYDSLMFESGIPMKGDNSVNIRTLTDFGGRPILPNASEDIIPINTPSDTEEVDENDFSIFGIGLPF